jgi:2-polyprenylphenol 6-hydroxylase
MSTSHYDVVIVGGGIVGLTLANALKSSGLSIAVVEQREEAHVGDDIELRVSAINPASMQVFEQAGVDPADLERSCRFNEMHVWDSTGAGQIHFDSAELGLDTLGYIIENNVLQRALFNGIQHAENIDWLCPELIHAITREADACYLTLASTDVLSCALVVGADGAHSMVRQSAGIEYLKSSYQQQGVVATVTTELPHRHTAWQCFLPSGPLAFLPLFNGQSSIVWSLDEDRANEIMALDDDAFCRQLERAFDYQLGAVTATSRRAAFALGHGHVTHYVEEQLALIGDAAHTIHPLAGQGANLGIMDAAMLAQVIIEAQQHKRQWSAQHTLRKFERARKGDNRLMENSMSAFKTLFGNDSPVLSALRNAGLSLADQWLPLKSLFMRHAMGMDKD